MFDDEAYSQNGGLRQIGSYYLIRMLGKGGFAQVWLGEHKHLRTYAAIKILRAQLPYKDQQRFLLEARIIAQLRHSHIVRVHDFGLEADTPFLVMEYAPHGSLRTVHPQGTCISLNQLVSYVNQAASALQFAHKHHLIHRDIKPENLLLGSSREVLLSDFGLALIMQSVNSQSLQDVSGTVTYMAPEVFRGQASPASDQYSLAIVVYEWLCGRPPFEGAIFEVCVQHAQSPPPPLLGRNTSISPEIEQVVMQALSKDPHQRFESVKAFALALEQAARSSPTWEANAPLEMASSADMPLSPSMFLDSRRLTLPSRGSKGNQQHPSLSPSLALRERYATQQFVSRTPFPQEQYGINPYRHRVPPLFSGQQTPISQSEQAYPQDSTFRSSAPHALHSSRQKFGPHSRKRRHWLRNTLISALVALLVLAVPGTGAIWYLSSHQQVDNAYSQATQGSPALNSSLQKQDASMWDEYKAPDYSCAFTNGAYHVTMAQNGRVVSCFANAASFNDFAVQVQMNILKGNSGGIAFRNNGITGYRWAIFADGSHALVSLGQDGAVITRPATGRSTNLRVGLDQPNVVTIVVRGAQISLYANGQLVATVTDSTCTTGRIGVFAYNATAPTEVAYSNVKVWRL